MKFCSILILFSEDPLHTAAACARQEMLEAMLNLGAKVDALYVSDDGKSYVTALSWAALHGNSSCLSLLLNAGAKVNFVNKFSNGAYYTALHRAIYHKHKECIKILLKNGADPNIKGKHPNLGKSQNHVCILERINV